MSEPPKDLDSGAERVADGPAAVPRYAGIAEPAQDDSAGGIAWLLPRCRWWLTEVEQCPGDAEPGEPFCWEHGPRFATVVPFAQLSIRGGS